MPPGTRSAASMAEMKRSPTFHLRGGDLRQRIWIRDVLVDEEATPAAFHCVVVGSMKWDARTHQRHVVRPFASDGLTWTEGDTVLLFEQHLLLQQEVPEILIGSELVTKAVDHLGKEIVQG